MRNQKEPKEKKDKSDKKEVRHYDDGIASVLRKPVIYEELRFFQRSDVLYQLTQVFCQRYYRNMVIERLTKWCRLPVVLSRI